MPRLNSTGGRNGTLRKTEGRKLVNCRLSNQIKAWRKHRGLSQQQLADAIGTTPQTVSRLERGVELGGRSLREKWVVRLTKALHCSETDLFRKGPDEATEAIDPVQAEQLVIQLLRQIREAQIETISILRTIADRLGAAQHDSDPKPKKKHYS